MRPNSIQTSSETSKNVSQENITVCTICHTTHQQIISPTKLLSDSGKNNTNLIHMRIEFSILHDTVLHANFNILNSDCIRTVFNCQLLHYSHHIGLTIEIVGKLGENSQPYRKLVFAYTDCIKVAIVLKKILIKRFDKSIKSRIRQQLL